MTIQRKCHSGNDEGKMLNVKTFFKFEEHNSQDNALVINDYPYGFKLRCKIRYWVEYGGKNKGYRFCSQTTDPRSTEEHWNIPKKSIYQAFMMMYQLENDFISYDSIHDMLRDLESFEKFEVELWDNCNDIQKQFIYMNYIVYRSHYASEYMKWIADGKYDFPKLLEYARNLKK